MKSTRLLLAMTLAAACLPAQETTVPEADVRKLADAYVASLKPGPKQEEAKAAFDREFERIDKLVKPASLLSLHKVWDEVFYATRTLAKNVSGLGRAEERKISRTVSGQDCEFRYGIILPNGYDAKKRYPLIIALHDKSATRDVQVNGVKYLDEVWMKLPKEQRDAFIIIAPNQGSAAAGKDVRVNFGEKLHYLTVVEPLKDVLASYPIDNDRIYLEGTGEGGEFALQFALARPHTWAAVAARSAYPRNPQLIQNTAALPVAIHVRGGSPLQAGKARQAFDEQVKSAGASPIVREHTGPAAKSLFASDPVPEATAEIAAFFNEHRRTAVPKKLVFVARDAGDNEPLLRDGYWVRLLRYDGGTDYTAKVTATVDGNTINVETTRIEGLRILLNDRLVDLDQPVVINVNGRPHTERLFARSREVLLDYADGNNDPALQPTASVDISIAPPEVPSTPPADPNPK